MDLFSRLEAIEHKIRSFKDYRKKLEKENKRLVEENFLLKNELATKKQEILNLVETNKISKLAQSAIDPQDRSELKLNIEQIIKEIDSCIRLIKQ